jgi:hypothetical protein
MTVFYYATTNRVSPFVALVGRWMQRSAMMRGINGTGWFLGSRPAIPAEVALAQGSTRDVAITWPSVREMLWTHRSEDLIDFYPRLVASLRQNRIHLQWRWHVIQKKKQQHVFKREQGRQIAAENRARSL